LNKVKDGMNDKARTQHKVMHDVNTPNKAKDEMHTPTGGEG
jgi:hypothetical protein